MIYSENKKLLEKALINIPLASQTYSKSYRYFTGKEAPHFIEKGEGAYVWDVDGNRYTDFICALGPITVGYNNKEVNEAIVEQLNKGIVFSKASPLEFELSELLMKKMPFIEMLRYMKNGSDVTAMAVRLARAYTGKKKILICGYHGIHDWYIGATANNKGVPEEVSRLSINFIYNDIDSLKKAIVENDDEIAAVIMEPIQGDGPVEGYLEEVREVTKDNKIILIFDEVVSGFRYAAGGASEYYNIAPDLITFGKGMANGMPLSVIGGRRDLLEQIETKNVFVSTTFGGECLSLAAAIKTIEILDRDSGYEHMWKLGTLYLDNVKEIIKKYELDEVVCVSGLPPHCGVIFNDYKQYSYLELQSLYLKILLDRGILSIGINNFCLAHTEEDVMKLNDAVEDAFKDISIKIQNGEKLIDESLMVDPVFKR